jgi:hypothetical protein
MKHELLTFTMNEAWNYLHKLLVGITDQEFFWEPVPNCWRIYQMENGNWTYDYEIPEPKPAPLTTIGWRLIHIASCKIMYYEYAFGPGKLTFPELVIPNTASKAVSWLEEGQALLTTALNQCTDITLETPALTNWGEWLPTWRIFWILISHDIQHGAEIGCLRDLYRLQHGAAG